MKYEYYIFLITGGPSDDTRVPIATFIESDYTAAKLYFQGYILSSERELKGDRANWYYKLHKIAKLERGQKLKEDFAFIEDSKDVKRREREEQKTPTQLQLEAMNRHLKAHQLLSQLYKSNKYPTQAEQVKAIFEGSFINE